MLNLTPAVCFSHCDILTRQAALENIAVLSGIEPVRNILGDLDAISVISRSATLARDAPLSNGGFLLDLSVLCLHSLSTFNLGSIPTECPLMERYHLGPHTTVQRLFSMVTSLHNATYNCQNQLFGKQWSLTELFILIAFNCCPYCKRDFQDSRDPLSDASQVLLVRVVKFLRHGSFHHC